MSDLKNANESSSPVTKFQDDTTTNPAALSQNSDCVGARSSRNPLLWVKSEATAHSSPKQENSQTVICIEGSEKFQEEERNANNENKPSGGEEKIGRGGRHLPSDGDPDLEPASSSSVQNSATGAKIAIMSRIIPISKKSSQVVPSSDNQDGAVLIAVVDDLSPSLPAEGIFMDETGCQSPCLHSVKKGVKDGGVTTPPLTTGVFEIKEEGSTESVEEVCRICHDNPSRMTLLSPCLCKGSMGKVHRLCLERWLGESAKTSCEICGHEYETERRPRYTGWRSVVAWIRNPLAPTDTRNLFFDLACFFILTPLAAISAWLCVVGAKHYSFGQTTLNPDGTQELPAMHDESKPGLRPGHQTKLRNKNIEASNSTWTSIGLLTLTGTLLAAYYVWLFVAVRYHIQVWREWQARNFVVTISPLNPERVRQLRQLREATAFVEVAEHQHQAQQQQQQQQDVTGQASGVTPSNNNNNVESSDESSAKAHKQNMKMLREKTLARAFEETASMDSTGSISDAMASSTTAGPSNFKSNRYNSDVDSIQGKVIIIPSEASCNIPDREI